MVSAGVHELIDELARASLDGASDADVRAGLGAARRLRAWIEGREVVLARRLAERAIVPEVAVAHAGQVSERTAARMLERAEVAASVPAFEAALRAGDVTGAHVDVIGRGLRRLEPEHRAELVARAAGLVAVASSSSPEDFARAVRDEVRRIEADDGIEQLARQRRATRLRTWVDVEGMWCLSGRFDPETGLRLSGRLANSVATLFAERVPPACPSDPGERQDFLRACALVALTEGSAAGSGRAEVVVVVDTTVPGAAAVDWGLPIELPHAVLAELAGTADLHAVVLRHGVVLHAPGRLELGRTTRLANPAQRRALRASYPTCAIGGCAVGFEHCKIHHVVAWEDGGATDLDNLVPLCVRHHHAVHDEGWRLVLAADRTLTVRLPDGSCQATGPPHRAA